MKSKEALGRLLMLARPCAYEVREHRNSYCDMLENTIKQDLERKEKLEKVIDILKDKFKFELEQPSSIGEYPLVYENYQSGLGRLAKTITKEEYELLKEVLEDE